MISAQHSGVKPCAFNTEGFLHLTSYFLILLWMFSFICLFNQIISKQALAEKYCAGLCRGSKTNKRETIVRKLSLLEGADMNTTIMLSVLFSAS